MRLNSFRPVRCQTRFRTSCAKSRRAGLGSPTAWTRLIVYPATLSLILLSFVRSAIPPTLRDALSSGEKFNHGLIMRAWDTTYRPLSLHTALEGESLVPSLSRLADVEGRDMAWLMEAPLGGLEEETADPLGACFENRSVSGGRTRIRRVRSGDRGDPGRRHFRLRNPPRLVLVFGLSQIVLVDRHKWPAGPSCGSICRRYSRARTRIRSQSWPA